MVLLMLQQLGNGPSPCFLQFGTDEVDTPAGFFDDFVEDFEDFFLRLSVG